MLIQFTYLILRCGEVSRLEHVRTASIIKRTSQPTISTLLIMDNNIEPCLE